MRSPDARSDGREWSEISAGIGGALALEFANTAGWHLSAEPSDRLTRWRDFARWTIEQELLRGEDSAAIVESDFPLSSVLGLREAIFRTGLAVATCRAPGAADLAIIMLAASAPLPEVVWHDGRLRWEVGTRTASEQLLGLIARDAIELLASARARYVRVCQGGECGWLFLDNSRGRPRRWCSMSDCGNRAKVRSAYERSKLRPRPKN